MLALVSDLAGVYHLRHIGFRRSTKKLFLLSAAAIAIVIQPGPDFSEAIVILLHTQIVLPASRTCWRLGPILSHHFLYCFALGDFIAEPILPLSLHNLALYSVNNSHCNEEIMPIRAEVLSRFP